MTNINIKNNNVSSTLTQYCITVLLIDDQAMIGEAVRRMLVDEADIIYHYCNSATKALQMAAEVSATIILQDISMPEIDGLTLAKFFRANAATRDIPLIILSGAEDPKVKADAFAAGANDYLVKFPDKIELIARIRYHSKCYINLLQRNEAFQALIASQAALATELGEAAEYVKSLFPQPSNDNGVTTDWIFVPSTQLGGDAFGYHWIDRDNLAIYLLDVCGHGVGAAMLSISIINAIRTETLPGTNFMNPANVLNTLNKNYQMEAHNNMFFTIWYGVYKKSERKIMFSSGGHPPAILLNTHTDKPSNMIQLKTDGPLVGCFPDVQYKTDSCLVEKSNKLYVFSDGVYEITKKDGTLLTLDRFIERLALPSQNGKSEVISIMEYIVDLQDSDYFDDDYSMLQIILN